MRGDVVAGHGPRIATGRAFDAQRAFEADEIGGGADVLGRHAAPIRGPERFGNNVNQSMSAFDQSRTLADACWWPESRRARPFSAAVRIAICSFSVTHLKYYLC